MKDDSDSGRLSYLERENAALHEQVKLLMRTEQRLYRSQSSLERELARTRALTSFALAAVSMENTEVIFKRASELLQSVFHLDRVVVLHVLDTRTVHALVADVSSKFEISPAVALALSELSEVAVLENARDTVTWPNILGAELGKAELFFSGASSRVIVLPIRSPEGFLSGALIGVATARPSFHVETPTQSHLPFLQLLATHIERASERASLTSALGSRGLELAQSNAQLRTTLAELERAQNQLLQAQKMEAVGHLAAGVAHEFNNYLTAILGHAELLRSVLPSGSEEQEDVGQIMAAGQRASDMVRQLLAFGRKQEQRREVVDVNEEVMNLARMLHRLIGEQIHLDLRLDPSLPEVFVDRAHLEQILLNLVVNSRDAMPSGGRLTIETRVASRADFPPDAIRKSASQYAAVSVSDNGQGMSDEVRARIFEPFFTTKSPGSGSGLGLSIVYGLVSQNEGFITAANNLPGSRFTLVFPICAPGSAHRTKPARPLGRRVLLAEDEEQVRKLASRVLCADGFEVIEARDGVEALELLERHPRPDLVVSDVRMPRMGGRELADKVRETDASIPILFVSGHTFDDLNPGELSECDAFLAKPFSPAELRRAARQAIERAQGRADSAEIE